MIHKTAVINPSAKLGNNVSVGPYTTIDADTVIGDNCVIGPRVSIMPYTTVGSGCRIHSGAVIGDLPQDFSFKECESFVAIGDNCIIREGVTIQRGTKPGTTTSMGNNCMLMVYSHLAHNAKVGNDVVIANNSALGGYAELGDRAFVSAFVGIHQFCKVGRLAMIGGIASISKDVLPYSMIATNAANKLVGMNIVGIRRAGITAEERRMIKQAFKLLFYSGLNLDDAVVKIKNILPGTLADELCGFIESSTRGLCRPDPAG